MVNSIGDGNVCPDLSFGHEIPMDSVDKQFKLSCPIPVDRIWAVIYIPLGAGHFKQDFQVQFPFEQNVQLLIPDCFFRVPYRFTVWGYDKDSDLPIAGFWLERAADLNQYVNTTLEMKEMGAWS